MRYCIRTITWRFKEAIELDQESTPEPKPDRLKDVMIQSMRDAGEILAAVPDLGFRAEDARAIRLSLFIART